jgi:hypothetical protein
VTFKIIFYAGRKEKVLLGNIVPQTLSLLQVLAMFGDCAARGGVSKHSFRGAISRNRSITAELIFIKFDFKKILVKPGHVLTLLVKLWINSSDFSRLLDAGEPTGQNYHQTYISKLEDVFWNRFERNLHPSSG